jgi:Holliday junction DNA helicase RuvA
MIVTLEGIVSEYLGSHLVLDVRGVGYRVVVAASDFVNLPLGQQAKLYIHEHIREDAHDLYGFSTRVTMELFEQLLSVKNVGPKVAIAVLDIGPVEQVRMAIAEGNVKLLQTAKGVGRRAAEQMVVELRDKVGMPVGEAAESVVGRAGLGQADDATQALVALGYSEYDAQQAMRTIDVSLPTEERIRLALKGGQ